MHFFSRSLCTLVVVFATLSTFPTASADSARIAHSKPVLGAVVREYSPPSKRWLAGHRGVDLAASVGDPIYASAAGSVSFSGSINGMTSISITHANGIRTTYQPVQATVEKGQRVEQALLDISLLRSAIRSPAYIGEHCGAANISTPCRSLVSARLY